MPELPLIAEPLQTTITEMDAGGRVPTPIVFYDGECGLCDRFVRFALRRDRARRLWFAPLQGSTYAQLAKKPEVADLASMVLADDQGVHTRSTAVFKTLQVLGGFWRVVGTTGLLIPRVLRDCVYRLVARVRHGLFGRSSTCHLATPAERARFLP